MRRQGIPHINRVQNNGSGKSFFAAHWREYDEYIPVKTKAPEKKEEPKPVEENKVEGERAHSATQADTMKTSLKLDRTIVATWKTAEGNECSGEWKNAYQMWKANPTWMTSSQQDTLTAKLYAAAKKGDKITVEINGRAFELLNV